MRRVLAISSGGGHWKELLRVTRFLSGCVITYATVASDYGVDVGGARLHVIPDATRWNKMRLAWQALRVAWLVAVRVRPHLIITSGAAAGYFAIRLGRLLGARTIWIDSMANVDELSLSGAKAGCYADVWLTQWPHLAKPEGPKYAGSVL